MRAELDGLPEVGIESSSQLGVRSPQDVTPDEDGCVSAESGGMSVAPNWRDLHYTRIPKRLRDKMPNARGSDRLICFAHGTGAFSHGEVAEGLILVPDNTPTTSHGLVVSTNRVILDSFQQAIANTRSNWQVDEA